MMSLMSQFCSLLPKVELHAHLNGSLSVQTLKELGCVDVSIVRYTQMKHFLKNDEESLKECFGLFKVAHDATNNPQAIYIATKRVIEDFANENVIYLELRTTPRSEEGMSKELYIESVIKAIKETDRDIVVKLILSINRSHDEKVNQDSLEVILKMKQAYPDIIRGIDLSGDPSVGKFDSALFKTAKENGLYTTLHCAEVKNKEEVKEMLNFGPDRIGHATFLHPNYGGCEENWNLYREKKIPVECCITSNVLCKTSDGYKSHHVQEWVKEELPFCVCTDDKGIFYTSLSQEYEWLQTHKVSNEELWKVSLNAMDYSFASYSEKLRLKCKLAEWKRDNEKWFE